jgi:hypothetical protein
MKRLEKRHNFILSWEEPSDEFTYQSPVEEFAINVSTDYPRLQRKLGGRSRRFLGLTHEQALAEARGYVDSVSLR